jgi:glutamate carboxypeptidase
MLAAITAFDAPSADPEARATPAEQLGSWLEEVGGIASVSDTTSGPLLDAEFEGETGGTTLILCHYDTVWPRGTVAERPFSAPGEIARGPGVLDMRGGIVAAFGAISILAELRLPRRALRILLTPDEETGSEASRETILARAGQAELVLVPEPALPDGSLKTSRKGWLLARLTAHGVAAHAGLEPERGASAVDELLAALRILGALPGTNPGTTVNVGLLSAPNPANVVAELATATVDIRFADAGAEARVRGTLDGLRPRDDETRLEVEELHFRPPLVRTPAVASCFHRARGLGASLGLELGEGHAGGVSDANLAALAGVPVLDGLGPRGGGAHAREEWVDIDSLAERAALIALLIAAPE